MNALLPFKIGREKLWFSRILVSNLQWLLKPFINVNLNGILSIKVQFTTPVHLSLVF